MASFKLLKTDKEAIKRAALAHRFDPERKKLAIEHVQLMEQCYKAALPEEERRTAARLPDRWIQKDTDLAFNVGGQTIHFSPNSRLLPKRLQGKTYITPQSYHSYYALGEAITGELRDQVDDWHHRSEKLDEEYSRISTSLTALLDKCTTVAKLKEVWPEGERFWKNIDFEGRAIEGLPVVALETLNKDLGLTK